MEKAKQRCPNCIITLGILCSYDYLPFFEFPHERLMKYTFKVCIQQYVLIAIIVLYGICTLITHGQRLHLVHYAIRAIIFYISDESFKISINSANKRLFISIHWRIYRWRYRRRIKIISYYFIIKFRWWLSKNHRPGNYIMLFYII